MLFALSTVAFATDWPVEAKKHRPADLAEGKPWVQLWTDQTPSNVAKPLETKLDPAKENAVCNGLDDDSDGKIDDKCGLETGAFQAVVSWDSHADIDVQVLYSPWDSGSHRFDSGKTRVTYGYGNEALPEGKLGTGRDTPMLKLQENRRGSCSCDMKVVNGKVASQRDGCTEEQGEVWAEREHYVENIFVPGNELPSGIYSISFYNHGYCQLSRRKEQVRVNVAVSVKGELVGHYRSGDLGAQGFSFPILHVFVP